MATASPRAHARSVLVGVGLGVAGIAVGSVLVVAAVLLLGAAGVAVDGLLFIVISLPLVQGVAFGGVALAYARYRRLGAEWFGVRVPTLSDLVYVVVGYVLALGAAMTGAVLVSLTGVEAGTNAAAELAFENPEILLVLIPASFLLIGPGEELLFRGVVQGRLRETFGAVPAVALASAVFAAIHFTALTGGASARLVSIGVLFLPSLVFGAAYELTDSVVVTALIHGAYNATLFTILYLVIRLGDAVPPPGLV
jgi:hypothetical protein